MTYQFSTLPFHTAPSQRGFDEIMQPYPMAVSDERASTPDRFVVSCDWAYLLICPHFRTPLHLTCARPRYLVDARHCYLFSNSSTYSITGLSRCAIVTKTFYWIAHLVMSRRVNYRNLRERTSLDLVRDARPPYFD
jgi:hypothetical protein